jgi:hypothetical protein
MEMCGALSIGRFVVKRGWDLAEQLLYGDSLRCSNFVLTPALSAVSAAMCGMQLVLPNGTMPVPTREASLVQIAML